MRGLGRLLALSCLLIALAVQSLAPAEAAAMRPDPGSMGICSAAHELGRGSHQPDPARSQDHDCCAFACAIAQLAAAPPDPAAPVRIVFTAPAGLAGPANADALSPSPVAQPRARGPPFSTLTI